MELKIIKSVFYFTLLFYLFFFVLLKKNYSMFMGIITENLHET
ncbi:hypothetical protein ACMBCN_03625 [Candidatus Liberibacter asiaticus]